MTSVVETFRIGRHSLSDGDVGIEVEVEGVRLPTDVEGWNVTHDGSLRDRGNKSALEYVFRRPYSEKEMPVILSNLEQAFKDCKSKVDDSDRCGVHVHVNVQKLNMTQLYNFFTLYLTFEGVLTQFCGESRVGNLFCLRAEDAEYLPGVLSNAVRNGNFREAFSDNRNLRYAAMNVCSLPQFGSLEFRSMRGTTDVALIEQWARLLLTLRERSKEFRNPQEIVEQASRGGEAALLLNTFGDEGRFLMDYPGWESSIMTGLRFAQEFAYEGDWEALSRVPKRKVGGVEVEYNFREDFPPMDV